MRLFVLANSDASSALRLVVIHRIQRLDFRENLQEIPWGSVRLRGAEATYRDKSAPFASAPWILDLLQVGLARRSPR